MGGTFSHEYCVSASVYWYYSQRQDSRHRDQLWPWFVRVCRESIHESYATRTWLGVRNVVHVCKGNILGEFRKSNFRERIPKLCCACMARGHWMKHTDQRWLSRVHWCSRVTTFCSSGSYEKTASRDQGLAADLQIEHKNIGFVSPGKKHTKCSLARRQSVKKNTRGRVNVHGEKVLKDQQIHKNKSEFFASVISNQELNQKHFFLRSFFSQDQTKI